MPLCIAIVTMKNRDAKNVDDFSKKVLLHHFNAPAPSFVVVVRILMCFGFNSCDIPLMPGIKFFETESIPQYENGWHERYLMETSFYGKKSILRVCPSLIIRKGLSTTNLSNFSTDSTLSYFLYVSFLVLFSLILPFVLFRNRVFQALHSTSLFPIC